jgi:hypothetical protein
MRFLTFCGLQPSDGVQLVMLPCSQGLPGTQTPRQPPRTRGSAQYPPCIRLRSRCAACGAVARRRPRAIGHQS